MPWRAEIDWNFVCMRILCVIATVDVNNINCIMDRQNKWFSGNVGMKCAISELVTGLFSITFPSSETGDWRWLVGLYLQYVWSGMAGKGEQLFLDIVWANANTQVHSCCVGVCAMCVRREWVMQAISHHLRVHTIIFYGTNIFPSCLSFQFWKLNLSFRPFI